MSETKGDGQCPTFKCIPVLSLFFSASGGHSVRLRCIAWRGSIVLQMLYLALIISIDLMVHLKVLESYRLLGTDCFNLL